MPTITMRIVNADGSQRVVTRDCDTGYADLMVAGDAIAEQTAKGRELAKQILRNSNMSDILDEFLKGNVQIVEPDREPEDA